MGGGSNPSSHTILYVQLEGGVPRSLPQLYRGEKMKYTKEVLEPLVRDSFSIAEVMRKLGLKHLDGGTHSHISRRIKKFEIDTSHLLGKRRHRSNYFPSGCQKIPWEQILVNNRLNGRKEETKKLRRAMIESGIDYICDTCGSEPIWKDRILVLQVSHKDGDSLNDERSNLHFECPNCHSQTDDYGGKGYGKNKVSLGV